MYARGDKSKSQGGKVEEFDPWDFFPWPQYIDVKCPVNSNGGSNYTFFDVAQGLVLVTKTLVLDRFCLVS
jgi:hypothetical protein